ncbi:extracellular solute-binding protein [Pseudoroseomonas wenyumeiae]
MANPQSSGTAYVMIATMVQLMGEDQAFEYLKGLHRNVNAYPRSGTGPIKAVARGETGVSISFVHDAVTERLGGFPVQYVVPCEGTGYEIGSMSIIAGARNERNAKRFYDWALSPAAQQIGAEAKSFQTPSNRNPHPGRGAEDGSDQADRLRLRQIRFLRRAPPADRALGPRGEQPAALKHPH